MARELYLGEERQDRKNRRNRKLRVLISDEDGNAVMEGELRIVDTVFDDAGFDGLVVDDEAMKIAHYLHNKGGRVASRLLKIG